MSVHLLILLVVSTHIQQGTQRIWSAFNTCQQKHTAGSQQDGAQHSRTVHGTGGQCTAQEENTAGGLQQKRKSKLDVVVLYTHDHVRDHELITPQSNLTCTSHLASLTSDSEYLPGTRSRRLNSVMARVPRGLPLVTSASSNASNCHSSILASTPATWVHCRTKPGAVVYHRCSFRV